MSKILSFLGIVFILLFLSTYALPISAQEASAGEFSISPINERLNVAPGESPHSQVTISNNSGKDLEFALSEVRFDMTDTGDIGFSDEEAWDWIELPSRGIKVPAGEVRALNFIVNVPEDAAIGMAIPAILIENKATKNTSGETGTGISVSAAFVVGINVIDAYPTTSVKVTNLSVNNPVTDGTVNIDYSYANILNAFTKPSGRLQLVAPNGIKVFEDVINRNLSTMAPGQVVEGSVTLEDGEYDLSQVGEYKVELLILDEQFDTADLASTQFIVVPAALLILVAAVAVLVAFILGILIAGLIRSRRRSKNKAVPSNSK